jgi:hypothetical protein
MEEIWKPIPGYEGLYEVSSHGRVRTFRRKANGRLLKPGKASHGYFTVALGRGKSCTLHSLVTAAFLGPKPVGYEVLHIDGSRTNNCVSNLRYGTRRDNILDAVAHGTWLTPARIAGQIKGRATRWGHR